MHASCLFFVAWTLCFPSFPSSHLARAPVGLVLVSQAGVCVLVREALVMLHTQAHRAVSPLAAPCRYDCWAHCRLSCSQLLGDGDHCS